MCQNVTLDDEEVDYAMKDGKGPNKTESELQALIEARLEEARAPNRVVVAPWGRVRSSAGAFVVDEESGRLVVEAFAAHGTDLPIDYEHQTLGGEYASPDGTAPAAGWITQLEAVPNEGIVATVNWTDEAWRMIAAKEYRYLSPVALIRRSDRKLIGLHSAALTNKPAIAEMTALVNRTGAASESIDTELAALRERLAIESDSGVEAVLKSARERIDALEADSARRDAESAVAAAMSVGKLTEAQRAWALETALQHRELFDAWLETAPVVVAMGRTRGPAEGSSKAASETAVAAAARAEYRASATLQGITSEEAYVADALSRRAG
jgi:phage I-like protein